CHPLQPVEKLQPCQCTPRPSGHPPGRSAPPRGAAISALARRRKSAFPVSPLPVATETIPRSPANARDSLRSFPQPLRIPPHQVHRNSLFSFEFSVPSSELYKTKIAWRYGKESMPPALLSVQAAVGSEIAFAELETRNSEPGILPKASLSARAPC